MFAAPQDQASKSAIEQQLAVRYRLSVVNGAGAIVTPGSVLVLQKAGLLMYTVANPLPPQSTYKNGKISRAAFGGFGKDLLDAMHKPGPSAAIDQRTLDAGEKLWVTKIGVQKDGVVFRMYDTTGCFGELKVPFAKNSVPPADALLIMVGEVLAVQPGDAPPAAGAALPPSEQAVQQPAASVQPAEPAQPPPPPAPVTINVGDSTDQVVASMGQPDRIAKIGSKDIYFYRDMKVTFVNGKVSDIE